MEREAGPAAVSSRKVRSAALAAGIPGGVALLLFLGWALLTQPLPGPSASAPGGIPDPARLEAHVRRLAEDLAPRDPDHSENLERAADYIAAELAAAGAQVREERFPAPGSPYRNVLGLIGPETRERVVVGAHYDAWGGFPGADDNASGVAGLIELARLLGREAPGVRVELAAYALEEPPIFPGPGMGSAAHAASLRDQGAIVRGMISLEMIGYFRDEPGSQSFPAPLLRWIYPERGDFIAVVGSLGQGWLVRRVKAAMRAGGGVPVHSMNAPRIVPGIDFSDHRSFWAAGYPAVMVTDTAFYRNPNYHSATDTPDTLDYRRMAVVVRSVHAAVLSLAGTGGARRTGG